MINVELKRSEWECYTDTPDSIIDTINAYFSYVLQTQTNCFDAQAEIFRFMNMFSEWGFMDSEPMQAATNAVNKRYKTNITRWAQIGDR